MAARKKRAAVLEDEVARVTAKEQGALRASLMVHERDKRDAEDEALSDELERLRKQRRARYLNWPREGVVVLASLLATGASANSVSLESFLTQADESYGAHVTVSPRVGVEFEPGIGWLRLRFGSYLEPARYETSSPRLHATGGFDLKLVYFSPGASSAKTRGASASPSTAPPATSTPAYPRPPPIPAAFRTHPPRMQLARY